MGRDVEQELEAVGENMKQLEISAEKAQEREEKLKDKIHQLMDRLKHAEARYEYGEMNITKLNHRIDDIEDEIYREKLKIKKVSDELNDTLMICLRTIRIRHVQTHPEESNTIFSKSLLLMNAHACIYSGQRIDHRFKLMII